MFQNPESWDSNVKKDEEQPTEDDKMKLSPMIKFQETVERTPEQQLEYNELYHGLKKKLMKVYRQKKGDKVSLCP